MGQGIAGHEPLHGLRREGEVGREHIARRQPEHRPQLRQRACDTAGRLPRATEIPAFMGV